MKLDETTPEAGVQNTPRAAEARGRHALPVGQLPTVSLLPREFLNLARERRLRRIFVGAVGVAVLIVAGASGIAMENNALAQQRATDAASAAQRLAVQVASFHDVQQLQNEIALGRAATQVATSTEIDWQGQLNAIEADMPSGFTVVSVQADSANVYEDYPQGGGPLDRPRAASLTLTATTADITHLPGWLYKLRSIPAYADATPVVSAGDSGSYSVQLTVHLSPKALIRTGKVTQ